MIDKLKAWLDEQSDALLIEHQGAQDNSFRREGMMTAVDTVLKQIEELANAKDAEDSNTGEPEAKDATGKE